MKQQVGGVGRHRRSQSIARAVGRAGEHDALVVVEGLDDRLAGRAVGVAEHASAVAAGDERRGVATQARAGVIEQPLRQATRQRVGVDVPLAAGVAEEPVAAVCERKQERVLVVEDHRAIARGRPDLEVHGDDLLDARAQWRHELLPGRSRQPRAGRDHDAIKREALAGAERHGDAAGPRCDGRDAHAFAHRHPRSQVSRQRLDERVDVGVLASVALPHRGTPRDAHEVAGNAGDAFEARLVEVYRLDVAGALGVRHDRHLERMDREVGVGPHHVAVVGLAVGRHATNALRRAARDVQAGRAAARTAAGEVAVQHDDLRLRRARGELAGDHAPDDSRPEDGDALLSHRLTHLPATGRPGRATTAGRTGAGSSS